MAAKSMEDIAVLLKGLRFRKNMLGGLNEADVWKQLDMLQKEYRAAFDAQEAYYQALLDERNAAIAKLKARVQAPEETQGDTDG